MWLHKTNSPIWNCYIHKFKILKGEKEKEPDTIEKLKELQEP